MTSPDDSDHIDESSPEKKRICLCCVGDSFLKALVEAKGTDGECSYCAAEDKTISIRDLADRIEQAFEEHYERTSDEPDESEWAMLSDPESTYTWDRPGEEVLSAIAGAANIDEGPARDVLSILEERHSGRSATEAGEECDFADTSYYKEKSLHCYEFYEKWQNFERSIKAESRFFNREAAAILHELFADITLLQSSSGQPVVISIGPESKTRSLYRARVFAGEDDKLMDALKAPWNGLGSPPMAAASAGRMNARGISVFYGASSPETAIAEVRPPVGSKVAVACFDILRPMRVLDVEALKAVRARGSIFDPAYIHKAKLALFMEVLSSRIVRPIMPNEEAFEYLATQAIADYLASEARLDGMVFSSVQTKGEAKNIVLFHHAARVEEIEIPTGTKISASCEIIDDDGAYPYYLVWEDVPLEPALDDTAKRPHLMNPFPHNNSAEKTYDSRAASLKIDLDHIKVHHVEGVSFSTSEFEVPRHRNVRRS